MLILSQQTVLESSNELRCRAIKLWTGFIFNILEWNLPVHSDIQVETDPIPVKIYEVSAGDPVAWCFDQERPIVDCSTHQQESDCQFAAETYSPLRLKLNLSAISHNPIPSRYRV
jgi:hypothetical protein